MKKVLLTSAAVVAAAAALNAAPVHAYGNWTGWNNGGAGSTNATAPEKPVNSGDNIGVRDHNDPYSLDYNHNSRNPMVKYGYIKYHRDAKHEFDKHVRVTVLDGGGRPVPNTEIDIQIIPTGNRANEKQQYENFTVKTNASGDADFSEILRPTYDDNGQQIFKDGKPVYEELKFKTGEVIKFRVTNPTPDFKSATGLEAKLEVGGDMYTNGSVMLSYKLDDRGVRVGEQPTTQTGWVKAENGTWSYLKEDGSKATGWVKDNGTWYYLNAEGVMQTGWAKVDGTWYYLKSSGAMATGWVKDNGTWYYLKSSGAMATGWYQVGSKWYYSYSSGALAVSTTTPDGYTVNENGEWV